MSSSSCWSQTEQLDGICDAPFASDGAKNVVFGIRWSACNEIAEIVTPLETSAAFSWCRPDSISSTVARVIVMLWSIINVTLFF
jgi:hypothetical protein